MRAEPSSRKPTSREVRRYLVAFIAACGLVGFLMFALGVLTTFQPSEQARKLASQGKSGHPQRPANAGKTRVRFLAPTKVVAKPVPEKRPLAATDMSGQVVETAKPMIEQVPDQAKYLGRYDMKVEREVKSLGRKAPGRDLGKMQLDRPSPIQSPQSTSKDETKIPKHEPKQVKGVSGSPEKSVDKAQRLDGLGPAPALETAESSHRQGSPVVRGKDDGLLLPATSPGNVMHNIQALSGNPGNNDYLPDVEDEGDTNLLNTRRFKYWDFFQRVKDRVSGEWEPGSVWRSRDPTGQRYGVKPRLTILRVTLDVEGALKHMAVQRKSGLEFLDDEAERAFTAAGPFPNPPRDMLRNGEIEFQFGFMFEVSTHRFKFFRVPQ